MAVAADEPTNLVSGAEVTSGQRYSETVTIRGVFLSAERDDLDDTWNWFIVRTPSGKVCAAIESNRIGFPELAAFRDAEVEVTGRVSHFGVWRGLAGYSLVIRSSDPMFNVLVPPPADPFSVPAIRDEKILHRQRVEGTVLARNAEFVFVTSTGEMAFAGGRKISFMPIALAAGVEPPEVGVHAVFSGFAELDRMNYRLGEAVWREVESGKGKVERGKGKVESGKGKVVCGKWKGESGEGAKGVIGDIEELYTEKGTIDLAKYGRLVELGGTLLSCDESGRTWKLRTGRRVVNIDLSGIADARLGDPRHGQNGSPSVGQTSGLPELEPGAEVSVSGIVWASFEAAAATRAFPRFRGISIVPRRLADVRVLRTPSWWTPAKLLVVISVLVAALIAVSVWNRALAFYSERRGRELYREKFAHAKAEMKVEERTRLAIEIHDSISQTLTGVAMQIEAGLFEQAKKMLASCRQELRCCLWDLRSRTFEEKDLTEAVRRTIAPYAGEVKTPVRFNVPRSELTEPVTHAVLKIIRELTVNAIRHGGAGEVRIAGEYRDGNVRFSVKDNGRGFDPLAAAGPADGHFGLMGIRERLKTLKGSLTIDSSPGKGTKVTVTI